MPWSTNLITDGVVTTEQVNAITDGSDTGAISGLNLELTAFGVITLRAGSGRYRTGGEFVTLTLPSDTILTPPTTEGLYLVTVRDSGDGETLEVVQRYLSADDEAYVASDLMRDEIQIGIVGVAEVGGTYFYSGYNRTKIISRDSIAQLVDFWRTFGPRQMIGDEIGISVSGDYTFDFTAGKYMSIGSGDDDDPHRFDAPALEVATGGFDVTVQYRDGSGGRTSIATNTSTGGIVLTPSTPSTAFWKYHDDGTGTLAAMGDEEWGVHLMYSLPTVIYFGGAELEFGLPILQISQVKFSDDIFKLSPRTGIISAIQTHDTHAFLRGTGPFIGAVAVRGDCTGLSSDPTKVELVSGTLDQIQGEISAGQLNFQATASMPGALYVDAATGDDATADGTMNLPYATIGAAVAALGANEEVIVNPGVYTENVVVGAGSEDIRISARIPRTVTWRGEASWTGGGGVLFDHTAAEAVNIRIEDIDFALAVNAVRTVSTGQVRVLGCQFSQIGWSGSGLSLQNPDDNAGTLGYDSDSADLVTYAASANVAAGWCIDIDGAAYASVNDCQFTYVHGSYSIANASQGFTARNNSQHVFSTAYKVSGSERVREYTNYAGHVGQSCYHASGNLLCTLSLSIGEGSWGPAVKLENAGDQVVRDVQLVDARKSDYTSDGLLTLSGAIHLTGSTKQDGCLFIASIGDTEILRSSETPVVCSGVYFDDSVGDYPDRQTGLISIDDVSVRYYMHGINMGELDSTGIRITIGDCQFTDIDVADIVEPANGGYYAIPYGNHITSVPSLDVSLDPLSNTIVLKEGPTGPVINTYPVNTLQAVATSPPRIILKGSEKIQLDDIVREQVSISGTLSTSATDSALVDELNAFFERLPYTEPTQPSLPAIDSGTEAASVAGTNYNATYMADLVGDLFGATTTGANHGTFVSTEVINEEGEYFIADINAVGKIYYIGITNATQKVNLGTGSGNDHAGLFWTQAIYSTSYGYPWTFYGSNATYNYSSTFFGNNGNFQYHAGLTDGVRGPRTAVDVVRWKIGIEDGYIKCWFWSVIDNEFKYVSKSDFVLTQDDYHLAMKFKTQGGGFVELNQATTPEPQIWVYRQIAAAPALTWYWAESAGSYYHPLFATEAEAIWVDENLETLWPSGGYTNAVTGAAATYTFADDEVPGRVWYMPQTLSSLNYNHASAPVAADLPESGQYSWNEVPTEAGAPVLANQAFTADEGSTVNFTPVIPADSQPATSWSATNLPAGLSIDASTGTITGVMPAASGSPYSVTITASNAYGNTSATLTLTANAVAITPVSGAHWYSDSTALVDSDTLEDGSLVAVDDLVTEGKRWEITRTALATNLGNTSGWTAIAGSAPTSGEEQVIYGFLRKAAAAPYTILDFELGVQFFEHSTEPQYRLFTSDGATVTQRGLLTGASPATTFSIADLFFEVNANHSTLRAALVTDPTDNVATTPYDELASTTVYEVAVDFPHSTITAVDGGAPSWIEVADGTGFAVGDHIHIADIDETAIIDSISAGGVRLGFASPLSAVPAIGTEVEVYSEVAFLSLNRTTDILSLGSEGVAPQALVSNVYHVVEDTFGLPLFNGHVGGDLTLNAGQTYKFWLDHDSIESTDSLSFVLVSDDSAYTTGVTTVGTPGSAGAYVEFAIPQDVPPVKFNWTTGGTPNYSTPTISGSTYVQGVTGITLEGPVANQTGTNLFDQGSTGWLSLDEPLGAGERVIFDQATLTEFFSDMPNGSSLYIGLKDPSWANTDSGNGFLYSTYAVISEVGSQDYRFRIHWKDSSGSTGSTSTLYSGVSTAFLGFFLEVSPDGNEIRIGKKTSSNPSDNLTTTTYDDWSTSYKGSSGNQSFGIAEIDVMVYGLGYLSGNNGPMDAADVDWTLIDEIAAPQPAAYAGAMDHAMTFSGGSKYQRQGVSVSSTATPMMMNSFAATTAAPLTSGYTSNDSLALPWAIAIMFRPTTTASNQHVWNLGEGTSTGDDNIYLRLSAGKDLFFGWGREGSGYNEMYIGGLSTVVNGGHWIGVYIAHNGTRWSGTDATVANLSDTFDIRYTTSVAWSQQDASSQWSLSQSSTGNRMDRAFAGSLTIGGRGSNRSFHGYVAHAMVTTLRRNQPMPDLTESEMMMMDPANWLATYRHGQTYRLTSGSEGTFALGTTNSANATQVWLQGDGAGDVYNSVENQVYPAHANTKLVGFSLVSTDLANITDPRP